MKIKYFILTLSLVAMQTIISPVYANGQGDNSPEDYIYAMMGGGRNMHDSGGTMYDNKKYGPGTSDRRWNKPDSYQSRNWNHREKIESLKRQIREKRKELTEFYRSNRADNDQIDQKVAELNDLEQRLDEELSGRN